MKILSFTDVHGDLSTLEDLKKKAKNADLVVCPGDFTFFEDHIEFLTKKIAEFGKDVLILHGNHEYHEVLSVLCRKYKNMHFMHKKVKKIGDYTFIGYGGGGFIHNDPEFVKTMRLLMKNIDKKEKIVLITHAPPADTKIDTVPGFGHVGNRDYTKFIKENNVVLSISGHLHEHFNEKDKVGKAKFVNPGYKGEIIELE